MSCSNCGSTTAGCGCKDTAYTTPVTTTCVPACPPKCAEYTSATCVLMNDGIDELGSNPGDTLESIIQRITLILTNPLCVNWNPGSGGGGGGIVSVGLVTSSNLFDTPIAPVTTPGGDLILNLSNQDANKVFAGPAAGPADTPAFRSLVIADIPPLTTGTSLLMGNGSGFFDNVTIGTNLSFSGGVLNANVNVVIGADNGLTKDPLSPDTVWLGGPVSAPGVLIQNTDINTTNQYRLKLYGNNPVKLSGVLEVQHNEFNYGLKATSADGLAVGAFTDNGVGVHGFVTDGGTAILAENTNGLAIGYSSETGAGISGYSYLENMMRIQSSTLGEDNITSNVLVLAKRWNTIALAGLGSALVYSLYNDTDNPVYTGGVSSLFTDPSSGSESADLEFSTIGSGTLETVGRFIGASGASNGQLQLTKYTSATSFTTALGLSLLGIDSLGKVVNSTGTEGLSFNGLTGNIELGRSVLAGTSDFSTNRNINAGTNKLIISGNNNSNGYLSNPTVEIINTTASASNNGQALRVYYPSIPTGFGGAALVVEAGSASGSTYSNVQGIAVRTQTSAAAVGITQNGSAEALNVYAQTGVGAVIGSGSSNLQNNAALMAWRTNGSNTQIDRAIQVNKNCSAPAPGSGVAIDYTLLTSSIGAGNEIVGRLAYQFDTLTEHTNYNSKFTLSTFYGSQIEKIMLEISSSNIFKITQGLSDYADDTAAAAGGIPVNGLYRTGSVVKIRVV